MKHPTKIFWLGLAAILAIVVLLTGCGTTSNLLVQPGTVEIVRPAQTNYVTLMLTNTVDGQEVITAAVQPVILPAITFTNQELTTLASSTINAAGTAGAVAGVPFSGLIANALLAGIGIALAWLNARAKRKRSPWPKTWARPSCRIWSCSARPPCKSPATRRTLTTAS
jgi:hypothetical protein